MSKYVTVDDLVKQFKTQNTISEKDISNNWYIGNELNCKNGTIISQRYLKDEKHLYSKNKLDSNKMVLLIK